MITNYPYQKLQGIGAIPEDAGASIPDYYLVPMSKTAIDIYIGKHLFMWKDSPFYADCAADWDGESHPCTVALLEIERHNLYFVNKIIDYVKLMWAYNESAKLIAQIPHFPSFKEQLQNSGKFLVGAVVGFFTAGPVGIFTGGAAVINEMLAKERARRAARVKSLLDPMMTDLQQAEAIIASQKQNHLIKMYLMWGGGALAVGGIVWWMLSD